MTAEFGCVVCRSPWVLPGYGVTCDRGDCQAAMAVWVRRFAEWAVAIEDRGHALVEWRFRFWMRGLILAGARVDEIEFPGPGSRAYDILTGRDETDLRAA